MASDIPKAFYTKLAGVAAVTSVVGTRIYHAAPPQGATRPFLVYYQSSYDPTYPLAGGAGFAQTTMAVDCIADNPTDSIAARAVVRAALDELRGTVGTDYINQCTVEQQASNYSPPVSGQGFGWFIHSIAFLVSHTEST